MTSNKKPAPKTVSVHLLCILSGDGTSVGPDVDIDVDAEEAKRLIGLGAARAVTGK